MPKTAVKTALSVYLHTHWDREWYLPFREYQYRLLMVVDDILNALDSGKLPCFCLDGQTVLLEDYLEFRPQNKKRIEALVKSDKLAIGPWYVMPDEHLISGESLVRNLKLGLKISKEFGEKTFTGYLPDTFGHSADIPMVLKQFEINSAIVWRGVKAGPSVFEWTSPSQDSVMGYHLTEGYFQNVFHMGKDLAEKRTFFDGWVERTKAANNNSDNAPILFPIGADHLGLQSDSLDVLSQFTKDYEVITPDKFMLDLKLTPLLKLSGELRDVEGPYLLPGVFSSRMYLKQSNRKLEWRLTRQLEQLLSWTKLQGTDIPHTLEMDLLWKTLMLNHPHDSICGCSVDSVHRENEVRFDHVDQLSQALVRTCHQKLQQQFSSQSLTLINLGDADYQGVVELNEDFPLSSNVPKPHAGSQVISEETLLDDGYLLDTSILPLSENKMIRRKSVVWTNKLSMHSFALVKAPDQTKTKVTVNDNVLENEYVRVQVSPQGELVVKDLKTGQFYPGLHQLWRNKEQGDSYNAAPVPKSKPEQAKLVQCEVISKGPLRGTLKLTWQFPKIQMTLETFITLDAGSPRLTFETRFINNTIDHKIQILFETHDPISEVIAEGHFAPVVRSYDPKYRIEDAMPAPKQKELLVHAGPIQRWIGLQNQTLLTEGLCEYEVEGRKLKLTLHRGFDMLSRDDTDVRGSHAGPPLPTPEGQCLNRAFALRYAWMPGFSMENAFTHADLLYGSVYGIRPPLPKGEGRGEGAKLSQETHQQFVSWDNPAIVSTAIIPGGDSWTLRLLNPTNKPQTAILTLPLTKGAKPIQITNLAGTPMGQVKDNTVNIPSCSTQTLVIPVQ